MCGQCGGDAAPDAPALTLAPTSPGLSETVDQTAALAAWQQQFDGASTPADAVTPTPAPIREIPARYRPLVAPTLAPGGGETLPDTPAVREATARYQKRVDALDAAHNTAAEQRRSELDTIYAAASEAAQPLSDNLDEVYDAMALPDGRTDSREFLKQRLGQAIKERQAPYLQKNADLEMPHLEEIRAETAQRDALIAEQLTATEAEVLGTPGLSRDAKMRLAQICGSLDTAKSLAEDSDPEVRSHARQSIDHLERVAQLNTDAHYKLNHEQSRLDGSLASLRMGHDGAPPPPPPGSTEALEEISVRYRERYDVARKAREAAEAQRNRDLKAVHPRLLQAKIAEARYTNTVETVAAETYEMSVDTAKWAAIEGEWLRSPMSHETKLVVARKCRTLSGVEPLTVDPDPEVSAAAREQAAAIKHYLERERKDKEERLKSAREAYSAFASPADP